MEDDAPPPKRVKYNKIKQSKDEKTQDHHYAFCEILNSWRQIKEDVLSLKCYLVDQKPLARTIKQDKKYEGKLPDLARNTKKLQELLGEIFSSIEKRNPPKCVDIPHKDTQVLDTTFNTIKQELRTILGPTSFAYLTRTSSSMFKLLSPVLREIPVRVPKGATEISFKFAKPTTLVNVETTHLPYHVTNVTFSRVFNHKIDKLPETITHLTFGNQFNMPVNYLLPSSLTHLTFGKNFNNNVDHLPSTLTHLTFGKNFNNPVDFLPESLTHLIFGTNFGTSFDFPPPALKLVEFGKNFTKSLNRLPPTVHTLSTFSTALIHVLPPNLINFEHKSVTNNLICALPTTLKNLLISGSASPPDFSALRLINLEVFGTSKFQPPLDNLPNTLKTLHIYGKWNASPLDSLPEGLETLTINSKKFDQPMDHFPSSLKRLELESSCPSFTHILTHLPDSLEIFSALGKFDQPLRFTSATSLKKIVLGNNFDYPVDHLPQSVTHIEFGKSFNSYVDNLPKNTKSLIFGKRFNRPVGNLPPNLTHLYFGENFEQFVIKLPRGLTHLTFGRKFNRTVCCLPPKLTHLKFGANFNGSVDELPPSLTHLTFGFSFDHPVSNLPLTLTHLTFGVCFDQEITQLPPHLIALRLGYHFNQKVDSLPSTLTSLVLGVKFSQPVYHLPASLTSLQMCAFFDGKLQIPISSNLPPFLKQFTQITIYDYGWDSELNYNSFEKELDPDELDDQENFAMCTRFDFWKCHYSCTSITALKFYKMCIL